MTSVAEHAVDLAPEAGGAKVPFGPWTSAVRRGVMQFQFDCARPRSFTGVIRNRTLAGVSFIDMACGKHAAYRDRSVISAGDAGLCVMTLQLSGQLRLAQDDRVAVLDPGMFALYDSSKPASIVASDGYQSTCIRFPKEHLGPHTPNMLAAITATAFEYAPGMTATVWDMLISLNRNLETLGTNAPHALRSAMDLVNTLLWSELGREPAPPRTDLLQRVKEHIDQHLADPDLTPEAIARAHHISARYLHRLFEDTDTSAARWIRARRIARCRRDLADPALVGTAAASIGARWGFPSPSHFGHVFKRETGRTPAEFRREATIRPLQVGAS